MDKKLIERIALEVACDVYGVSGKVDFEEMFSDKQEQKFLHAFISRIDAERGKDAVAWRAETGYEQPKYLYFELPPIRMKGEPLFLSTTIPECMALVPIEPTTAMIYAGINTPVTDTGDEIADRLDDYRAVWKSMISAAKGERNAE